ncbi:SDR family oxidoreductase [Methylobacterium persicinum]|uniref:NAD(P)-dependent dehydrogenase (Short-subunit alcohol dehydrogenase family) n=1 Tax=Methylobacterium persicinum TaxID=374426 RepID=A0ABU0HHM5_9HYPH|nr:SDR family oxidoreductase [Methylobacterium persicinum]MDQ0440999.1 NAD(P)-dependent dehydrogenase (short-subunit alcohol dehydrogenase family) [Methylobacterium persicinum]GJE40006.1 3-oxoacyl-[acyl-carrier-protein] reductase FabG [Methylobacterium persicinum]
MSGADLSHATGGEGAKRILVTGGGTGLGAAIVRGLVQAGHAVDFTYRASGEAATALAAELNEAHPGLGIRTYALDLADGAALDAFCENAEGVEYHGLVHNAGQSSDGLAAMFDQDRAEAAMQVNFYSLTRLAKALVRGMTRARSGRIVAIGSVAALRGNAGNAAYAATKGALIAYCRTLAVETAKRGVTVNVIAPGFIDTAMLAPYAAHRAGMERQIPAGRFARPEEVAALTAFLMGEGAAYITGAVLPVDGGLTAMMGVHRT